MAFDSCLDTNLGRHCMTEDNLAQMINARYGGLTGASDLGSRIVNTLPPKPNESHESRWRLYVYCAPCTQIIDLAFGIAGHIVGFNAIVRVDNRLEPRCCKLIDIPEKLATFSALCTEIQREWRNENKFERSWISSGIDIPWLQQSAHRARGMDRASDISMETFLSQAYVDRTCSAVIVLAPAKSCSALLASYPDENGNNLQVESGDIFELQYQGQNHELPWVPSFFGTIH